MEELLAASTRDMWNDRLYGSSGEIVAVALSQASNMGGQPYMKSGGMVVLSN